jgi:hypothetical protein
VGHPGQGLRKAVLKVPPQHTKLIWVELSNPLPDSVLNLLPDQSGDLVGGPLIGFHDRQIKRIVSNSQQGASQYEILVFVNPNTHGSSQVGHDDSAQHNVVSVRDWRIILPYQLAHGKQRIAVQSIDCREVETMWLHMPSIGGTRSAKLAEPPRPRCRYWHRGLRSQVKTHLS